MDDSLYEAANALREALDGAEAVVIGAGAGLSAAAGYGYSGERFQRYFADLGAAYGFSDMYAGGFYPYPDQESLWAFWSRSIYINRYMPPPKPVYDQLLQLVKDKDYFVLTTNVDHCFQRAGFAKARLFYTQGDYGLWQCATPCHPATYDNAAAVRAMVEAQGFTVDGAGNLTLPAGTVPKGRIPTALLPRCPVCGEPMRMNLRADDSFVEDAGWHRAAERYAAFLEAHENRRTLFWEIGVGWNTPGIIKYSFWRMTAQWPRATYACLNLEDAYAPEEIAGNSLLLPGDIGEVLQRL